MTAEWKDLLKGKPIRYWSREKIEQIIKDENIDRLLFHEVSKLRYESVRNRFISAYFRYDHRGSVCLPASLSDVRDDIELVDSIFNRKISWNEFLARVQSITPCDEHEMLYLILDDGWVYEGRTDVIFKVLAQTDGCVEDFYIISKKFKWTVVYCEDGDCAHLYRLT